MFRQKIDCSESQLFLTHPSTFDKLRSSLPLQNSRRGRECIPNEQGSKNNAIISVRVSSNIHDRQAAPHGGSYAYTISNLGYGSLNSDKLNVSANTTYDAYAWVRGELDAEDGLGNWILLLRHYDSANNLVRSDYIDQGGPDTISTTWQQKGGRFTTPSNGAKASIRLWIQLGSGWVTYDDISQRPVVTYNLSYDAENRPSGCALRTGLSGVSGATTASFVYDGDGRRVKATAGGVTTAYVGNYFEWTGSTSTMVKYYYAGTARIAMRTGSGTGTTGLNWLLGDHLGSTTITADASGNKVAELRYKAWGEFEI